MSDFPVDQAQQRSNNMLLDYVAGKVGARTDAALAKALRVSTPVVSKIRHGRLPIGATIQLTMLEELDVTLQMLRAFVPSSRSASYNPAMLEAA